MTNSGHSPPASRRAALRDGLKMTAQLLRQPAACDIPAGYVEDYLALDWLEWHEDALRLTTAGHAICRYAALRHNRPA